MIIDHTYFSSYQDASKLSITKLDDPLGDFWLKDWFVDFPNKHRIFVHSFPQHEADVNEVITFCKNHREYAHIIILHGQSVPMHDFFNLVQEQDKVYILNDYGHSSNGFFPMISSHRTLGQGYLKKVPFVPWTKRKYTMSSLSSRYEPHRWILTAHLNILKRKDVVFSFHNAYPMAYDVKYFIENAKMMCDFEIEKDMADSVQDLINRSPIVPAGMNNPRPNGNTNSMTMVYDQCELGVYLDSKINLTMEGQYVDTGVGCNITEKTLKCLATGCFPLHVGQSGFYNFLETMGFKFDVGLDLSYDNLPHDSRRVRLQRLIDITKDLYATDVMEQVTKQNYDWFHNDWYAHCEKINRPVLENLIEIIHNEV